MSLQLLISPETRVTQSVKPWKSVAANLRWSGECTTSATTTSNPAAPGGSSCYSKTFFIPGKVNVLRVTWSTTGDSHSGAAMQMACLITNGAGVTTFCQTGFGADGAPSGWLTALLVPTGTGNTNCNDGGGGSADCHDNSIYYAWCVQVLPKDVYTIDLRMGSSDGGTVFTEKSTFYIDSTKLRDNDCVQRFPPS